MIPHQGDGFPLRQNFSGSYGPGESGKPRLNYLVSQNLRSPEPFRSKKDLKFHQNKEKSQPENIKFTFIVF